MKPLRTFLPAGIFSALMCFCGAASADDGVELELAADRLSLRADAAPVAVVLTQVAQAIGARLTLRGQLPAEPRRWRLRDVRVADAVVQIARPWNILVVPGGEHGVREIYVFGSMAAASAPPTPAAASLRGADPWRSPSAPDAETMARREAVAMLGSEPAALAIGALDAALGDPDAGVRLEALRALGRHDTEAAIRLVGQVALGARNAAERSAALQVLEASRQDLAQVMLAAIRARSDEAFGDR